MFMSANRCVFEQDGFRRAVHSEGDIYTVEQWSRKFLLVRRELCGTTTADVIGRFVVTTRAGIGRSDEHDVGRVGRFDVSAADGDLTIFERLAERFKNAAWVLGEFV